MQLARLDRVVVKNLHYKSNDARSSIACSLFSSFLTNILSYDLFHTFLREVGNLILEGIHSSGNHCTNLVARGSLA